MTVGMPTAGDYDYFLSAQWSPPVSTVAAQFNWPSQCTCRPIKRSRGADLVIDREEMEASRGVPEYTGLGCAELSSRLRALLAGEEINPGPKRSRLTRDAAARAWHKAQRHAERQKSLRTEIVRRRCSEQKALVQQGVEPNPGPTCWKQLCDRSHPLQPCSKNCLVLKKILCAVRCSTRQHTCSQCTGARVPKFELSGFKRSGCKTTYNLAVPAGYLCCYSEEGPYPSGPIQSLLYKSPTPPLSRPPSPAKTPESRMPLAIEEPKIVAPKAKPAPLAVDHLEELGMSPMGMAENVRNGEPNNEALPRAPLPYPTEPSTSAPADSVVINIPSDNRPADPSAPPKAMVKALQPPPALAGLPPASSMPTPVSIAVASGPKAPESAKLVPPPPARPMPHPKIKASGKLASGNLKRHILGSQVYQRLMIKNACNGCPLPLPPPPGPLRSGGNSQLRDSINRVRMGGLHHSPIVDGPDFKPPPQATLFEWIPKLLARTSTRLVTREFTSMRTINRPSVYDERPGASHNSTMRLDNKGNQVGQKLVAYYTSQHKFAIRPSCLATTMAAGAVSVIGATVSLAAAFTLGAPAAVAATFLGASAVLATRHLFPRCTFGRKFEVVPDWLTSILVSTTDPATIITTGPRRCLMASSLDIPSGRWLYLAHQTSSCAAFGSEWGFAPAPTAGRVTAGANL